MATIVDYASLKQSVTDFTHRADLASGGYVDYFIQSAQEKIQQDIFSLNFGNGLKFQEVAYAPSNITGGTLPVPADWLSPKVMTVQDGSSDQFTLIFKPAAWIYDRYYFRQPMGLPAYIARDVQVAASFTASITSGVMTVTAIGSGGPLTIGMILSGSGIGSGPGGAVMITAQLTGTTGSTGTYSVASCNPIPTTITGISSETITAGGNVFVFGPYPDSSYQVSGTYYQNAALLSGGNTTNWMVLNAPYTLQAACMIKAGEFLLDDAMIDRWTNIYEPRLKSLIDADKAERWASTTLQVEVG